MLHLLAAAQAEAFPAPGRVSLYPGAEVVWDDCCDGQLWLRVLEVTPAGLGQQQSVGQSLVQPCGVPAWTALYGLGLVRCVSALDDQGNAPASSQLTEDTLQGNADRASLLRAITCTIPAFVEKITIVNWLPLGPEGGCAGGEWQFKAQFSACGC